jgi:hypothetical protein
MIILIIEQIIIQKLVTRNLLANSLCNCTCGLHRPSAGSQVVTEYELLAYSQPKQKFAQQNYKPRLHFV